MSGWWLFGVALAAGAVSGAVSSERYHRGFQAGVTTTLCIQQAAEDKPTSSCDRLSKQQREYALSVAWEITHRAKP